MGKLMINGEQYPAIVVKAGLDDAQIRKDATWSSNKINEELEDVRSELDIIVEEANKNTTINDEVESLTTVWSSKKTSGELDKKSNTINISMVGLGFTKGAEVPLEDFMIAISKKMSNNYSTIYKVNWTDENSAYVVFNNKKVNINGGVLYCSQSNTITNTWTDLTILYTPNVSSPNLYKFTARKDGSTLNVYMFEYPYMADTTSSTTSTWSSSKIASEINNATAIKYDNTIAPNTTKETSWNLAQEESHFYGRLLQLDGHLGSKSSTFSFLLFVKANYDNPTTVYVTHLVGMDDDRTNTPHTTYFELGVSSSGNLTITNKSAVTASYRFI